MAYTIATRKKQNIKYKTRMSLHISLLLLMIPLAALSYPYLLKKIKIKRWYNALQLNKHQQHYQRLFRDTNGFDLSRQARAAGDAIEYTYGEIDFISFIALLSLTNPSHHTRFYDLGSGTGKAVVACAMVFNVQKSCGIELFDELHQAAQKQQLLLQQIPNYTHHANTIQFINADFLQTDISDATLIFLNATAFFGETWGAIHQYLSTLNSGTIIITTSKKLPADNFVIKNTTIVQMSWGMVSAYIQERI
jgi:hypothetical protein